MLRDLMLNSTARHALQVLPIALLAGILVWVLRRKKAASPGREFLILLFTCYTTGLLCMVLAPRGLWQSIWYSLLTGQVHWQVDPLFSGEICLEVKLLHYLTGRYTAGSWTAFMYFGNIAMLIPMGIFLPPVFRQKTWQNLLMGLGFILAMEALQPITGRSFDADDLICNALGLILGLIIVRPFVPKTKK